jgi:hypothetical protein
VVARRVLAAVRQAPEPVRTVDQAGAAGGRRRGHRDHRGRPSGAGRPGVADHPAWGRPSALLAGAAGHPGRPSGAGHLVRPVHLARPAHHPDAAARPAGAVRPEGSAEAAARSAASRPWPEAVCYALSGAACAALFSRSCSIVPPELRQSVACAFGGTSDGRPPARAARALPSRPGTGRAPTSAAACGGGGDARQGSPKERRQERGSSLDPEGVAEERRTTAGPRRPARSTGEQGQPTTGLRDPLEHRGARHPVRR